MDGRATEGGVEREGDHRGGREDNHDFQDDLLVWLLYDAEKGDGEADLDEIGRDAVGELFDEDDFETTFDVDYTSHV